MPPRLDVSDETMQNNGDSTLVNTSNNAMFCVSYVRSNCTLQTGIINMPHKLYSWAQLIAKWHIAMLSYSMLYCKYKWGVLRILTVFIFLHTNGTMHRIHTSSHIYRHIQKNAYVHSRLFIVYIIKLIHTDARLSLRAQWSRTLTSI